MKTVVSTLLAFFFIAALFAQNFVADEFIVEYVAGTTNTQQQAVRDLFGITNTTNLGENIELWEDIDFPLSVTENGETTIIDDVEELLYYIDLQGVNDDDTSTTANINNGNANLLIYLDDIGALYSNGNFDPLPYCDDVHNDRLIGEDQSGNPNQGDVKIIIVDQQTSGAINVPLIKSPINPGGNHGTKVLSVIQDILAQAGATEVEYYNLIAFDDEGTSTISTLIAMIDAIVEQYENGNWDENDKVIVNFSANITIPGNLPKKDYFNIIEESWYRLFGSSVPGNYGENILVVSAAGNQGSSESHIFPGIGCDGLFSEITVAGTQNCFSEPWEDTNANSTHFEIAAEAENILTNDGSNYYLSSGTSFAVPMVTAVVAQLALSNPSLNITQIKNLLFESAEEVPALLNTVQNGRVLNIGNYVTSPPSGSGQGHGQVPPPPGPGGGFGGFGGISPLQSTTPTSPLTLTTTPNPFATTALVTIELPEAGDVTISMYNMIGQRVHEEFISNQQDMIELEWPTPATLTSGTYLLRVQAGEAVEQMMMVKQ